MDSHKRHLPHQVRLLFCVRSRGFQYGLKTPSGLLNSVQQSVKVLAKAGITAQVVDVVDDNAIDREVALFKPTHVCIDAIWVRPSKLEQLLVLYPHVQWTVRSHSKAPFLAGEGNAMEMVVEMGDLADKYRHFTLSANSQVFTEELADALDFDVQHLPNLYDTQNVATPPIVRPGELHVGCFGAVRLLKNQFIQAIAAVLLANDLGVSLKFHMNGGGRVEMAGEQPLKNIRAMFAAIPDHQLIEHGWLDNTSFLAVVRQMDIGMQVSYSESFNIVAADFVDQGVPIVVSPDITWLPSYFKADPNSSDDMVRKMKSILAEPRPTVQRSAETALLSYNQQSTQAWTDWLTQTSH